MEAISTSAVTTVEDTSFVVLTDVFVSRDRSKGASIDDRSARGVREKSSGGKKKAKEGTRIARQSGEGCAGLHASSRRVYLSSKQKMRARRWRSEESQQEQQQQPGVGGEEKKEEKRYAPHSPRQKAGRPLFIFRPQHNILLQKAAKGRHDLRAAVPLPFAIAL